MKTIELQFYPLNLYLTTDAEEFKKHIDGKYDFEKSIAGTGEYVDFENTYKTGIIVYFNLEKVFDIGNGTVFNTIAHESLHALNRIYNTLGIEPSLLNDENAAYLLGFIVDECFNFIKAGEREKLIE